CDDRVDRERLEDLSGRLAGRLSGRSSPRHAYLITFDSARNSSEPARCSRSNTQTSVEVTIAPARSISPRPTSRFCAVRLHTASAHAWTVQPRAARSRALWDTHT